MRERSEDFKDKLKGSSYDQYHVMEVIGSGTFGKVYLVKHIGTEQLYAMKRVLQNSKYKNRQLEILSSVKSQYVVKLYRNFYMEQKEGVYLNLIMEYIPETLSRILKTNYPYKKFIENDTLIAYSKCLFIALRDLHEVGICHRDIKPSNILITEKQAKICDFGSAKVLSADQKNISYICSRYYRAPQLLLGANFYSIQVDIWSLGCVIAEMMTNHSLFEGANSTAMLLKIVKTIGRPTEDDIKGMKLQGLDIDIMDVQGSGIAKNITKYNKNAPQQLINLLQRVLVYNPERRITARQALELPVFK